MGSDAQVDVLNASGRFHFLKFYTQRHDDRSDTKRRGRGLLIEPAEPRLKTACGSGAGALACPHIRN